MKKIFLLGLLALLLALPSTGCKVMAFSDGQVHYRSYSLGTKTVVADIDAQKDANGISHIKVSGYTSENQEVKAIVEAGVQAAVAAALKSMAPAAPASPAAH